MKRGSFWFELVAIKSSCSFIIVICHYYICVALVAHMEKHIGLGRPKTDSMTSPFCLSHFVGCHLFKSVVTLQRIY